jgi:hypothetical protein
MCIARPIAVFISAIGSNLTLREIALISWIGPRGIVAAAIAALFAIRLEEAGYPDSGIFCSPDIEQYKTNYADRSIPLFAIDPKQRLHVFVENGSLQPKSDWTVISLIQPENSSTSPNT